MRRAPTIGNWRRRGKYSVIDSTGKCVTRLRSNQQYRTREEDEANAIVISYAAEMRELLINIKNNQISDIDYHTTDQLDRMDAELKKK